MAGVVDGDVVGECLWKDRLMEDMVHVKDSEGGFVWIEPPSPLSSSGVNPGAFFSSQALGRFRLIYPPDDGSDVVVHVKLNNGARRKVIVCNAVSDDGADVDLCMNGACSALSSHNDVRSRANHQGRMAPGQYIRKFFGEGGESCCRPGATNHDQASGRVARGVRALQKLCRKHNRMGEALDDALNQQPKLELLNANFASKGLINHTHCDKDSSQSFAIWMMPKGATVVQQPALAFPTLGIAVILRHGTIVSWFGDIPHCTTATELKWGARVNSKKKRSAGNPEMFSLFASRNVALDSNDFVIVSKKRKRSE
eukprot:CAMPEP_0170132810 /NCGR_PEP_ID=MMETSP0033_2-20121228/840_1 /TAXON_ID=195969 /ORGANISM="Dolichomastix tenuilepis, Strain CCMP3274" /LENGTH=311 /DNA_ID=CAMNT_0010368245 /DNA_START=527 /DNA_END=1462 /DNA_ORIENTATION=+